MMGGISVISGEYMVEAYKASGSGFEMSLMALPDGFRPPLRITVAGPAKPLLHAPIPSRVRVKLEEATPNANAKAGEETASENGHEGDYERPLVGVTSNGSISLHLRPGKVNVMPLAKAQDLYSDLAAALRETARAGRSAFHAAVNRADPPVPDWMLIQARGRRDWDRHARAVRAILEIYETASNVPGSLERALKGRVEVLTDIYGPEPHCRMTGDSGGLELLADKIVAEEGKR